MKRILLFFVPLILGLVIAVALWNHIWLPFSNPLHIISQVTEASFNPANNSLRFAVLLAAPLLLLFAAFKFKRTYFNEIQSDTKDSLQTLESSSPKVTSIILVSVVAILSGLLAPTFIASGEFDPFHEGESLAPAVSYEAGQVPYKDMVFIHGVYQDPVRSTLAFSVFGRSIGAVRTWESGVKILTWIFLGIFVLHLYHWKIEYALLTIIVLGIFSSIGGMILLPRDLLTLVLLNTFGVIARSIRTSNYSWGSTAFAAFMLGLLPPLGLGFSVDRGVYYSVISIVFIPLLYFYFYRKTNQSRLFFSGIIGGLLAGILLLGVLLKWNYSGFLTFCFVQVPQYKELMDSYIFPVFNIRFSASVLLAAMLVYYYGWKLMGEYLTSQRTSPIQNFLKNYLLETVLLLVGLLLMRNVLGRADMVHVKYSWFALLLSAVCIFFRTGISPLLEKYPRRTMQLLLLFISAVFVGYSSYTINHSNLIVENFPLNRSDDFFIPAQDKATVEFLKKTIQKDEEFLTLTGEGAWYYYLNKPCPTRFTIIQFAMTPEFQREVLRDFTHKNIKYILYSNSHWANRIDGFTNEQRLPEIMKYIHDNYHLFKTIDHNQLWVRNNLLACK